MQTEQWQQENKRTEQINKLVLILLNFISSSINE